DNVDLDIQTEVLAMLARIDPHEDPFTVMRLVNAAADRALQPWRATEERHKARHTAVARALRSLPAQMGWDDEWAAKARKAANDAIDGARGDAPPTDLAVMAEIAVRPLIAQFRHDENIRSVIDSVRLAGANYEDQQDAQEAVAAALSELSVSAD